MDIEEDQQKYGGKVLSGTHTLQSNWRSSIYCYVRTALRGTEIRDAKGWPTLGAYIRPKSGPLTPHQQFLKSFTYMAWRQYSALSHSAFEGYVGDIPAGAYLA